MKRSQSNEFAALYGRKIKISSPWSVSPNDVLVQIALPLILVLAIIIQLMKLKVSSDESYLEPWKQQIILRINLVQSSWQIRFRLNEYVTEQDIVWSEQFPNDKGFSVLNQYSQRLADIHGFSEIIYKESLSLTSDEIDGTSESNHSRFRSVWDADFSTSKPEGLSDEFIYDAEKRAFALEQIEEQLVSWKQQVESLQWAVVNRVVSKLTLNDALSDSDPATQMQNISNALSSHGYPLLPSVLNEYAKQ